MRSFHLRQLLWALPLAFACVDDLEGGLTDAGTSPEYGDGAYLPPGCVEDGINAPMRLECTGLYSSLVDKQVHPSVREFSPAVWLWSDNADKKRWIQLPPGTQIDTSNPSDWVFPVGTKFWKEFKHNGQRIETRFLHKVRDDHWLEKTYLWKDNETNAELFFGGEVPVPGGTYDVPEGLECTQCHKGSGDNILGFGQVLLGLPGATGVTLATLVAEGRLTQPPTQATYAVPDDGTGLSAEVLPWMHVNCGVSCHNENSLADANNTKLFLRLEVPQMETLPVAQWNPVQTMVSVPSRLSHFSGQVRVVPGSPEDSLLYRLAMNRSSNQQMPLIGTRIVDEANMAKVRDWIVRLGNLAPDAAVPSSPIIEDAGSPAPEMDASTSPGMMDAGVMAPDLDAYVPPAAQLDAFVAPLPDAATP